MLERRFRSQHFAATKIQALYRGYALRSVMRQVISKANMQQLAEIFLKFDAKENGMLNFEQFNKLLNSITPRIPENTVMNLFIDCSKASEVCS